MLPAYKAQASATSLHTVDDMSLIQHVLERVTYMVSTAELSIAPIELFNAFVKAEVCTLCRKQNFLQCPNNLVSHGCDLIDASLEQLNRIKNTNN